MRIKTLIFAILTAVIAVASAGEAMAASQKAPKIEVKKYRITDISPEFLNKTVNGTIELTLENRSAPLTLRNINGLIYKHGQEFIKGYCLDITLPRGISVVTIQGTASLCDGVSILEVLKLINFNPDDFSVDFSVNCTFTKGRGLKIERKGIPLRQILN